MRLRTRSRRLRARRAVGTRADAVPTGVVGTAAARRRRRPFCCSLWRPVLAGEFIGVDSRTWVPDDTHSLKRMHLTSCAARIANWEAIKPHFEQTATYRACEMLSAVAREKGEDGDE